MSDEDDKRFEESFLELAHWISLDDWEKRERLAVSKLYRTFDQAAAAIDRHGPLEVCRELASAFFIRTSGRFENDIIAIRQSGLNVRRILISKDTFAAMYGSFQRCVDSVLSNNAIGPEVEIAHLKDYAEARKLDGEKVDGDRRHDRAEIDAISIQQMLLLRDIASEEYDEETVDFLSHIFDLGFTAGRNFSSIQNLMTLEPHARQFFEIKERNIAKGKNSGSDERRRQRLDGFIDELERVFEANPALRGYEEMALRAAFDKVVPPGEYGHGQFEAYCTELRSNDQYKHRFDRLFRS